MAEELIYGFHAVLAALEARGDAVAVIWLDRERHDKRVQAVVSAARAAHIKVQQVPRVKLDQLAGRDVHHQGVVARVQGVRFRHEKDLAGFLDALAAPPFLLVLDGVQDPHNLGACLRSAEAAGVHAVVLPKDRAAPITAVVRKAASGAAELLPIFQVTNLARVLAGMKQRGVWVLGAAGDAEAELYGVNLTGPLALVLGGEGRGLRRLTKEQCDVLVRIPMAGRAESLNVSVAAGIVLFEAVRQRSSS